MPEQSHDDPREAGDLVKTVLLKALASAIDPLTVDAMRRVVMETPGKSTRLMLGIPSLPASVLSSVAKSLGLTPGPTAKRLLGVIALEMTAGAQAINADVDQVASDHPMALLASQMAAMGASVSPRLAQAQLYSNIMESAAQSAIGLVEGGTGIGKTRAMVAAAADLATDKNGSVGICAPTIALLRQFANEYREQSRVRVMPPLQLILGRREFVSESSLCEFLTDKGSAWDNTEVRDWLKHAGRHEVSEPDSILDTSWQVYSLLKIAPDFPLDEVRLYEGCPLSDPGYKAYRAQFLKPDPRNESDNTLAPHILLFSHAMLAQDMRRALILAGQDDTYQQMQEFYFMTLRSMKGKSRTDIASSDVEALEIMSSEMGLALNLAASGKTVLPPHSYLLIDEAHILDESISSSTSEYLSLRSLQREIEMFVEAGGRVMSQGLAFMSDSVNNIIANAPSSDKRELSLISNDTNGLYTQHLRTIANICESASKPRDESSDRFGKYMRIRRAGILIDAALTRSVKTSYLRHSSVRSLPQLLVSNANVNTILTRLWSSKQSVSLVSATLYLPTNDGPSPNFMAGLLQLPQYRLKTFIPVQARWLTECVEGVWIPEQSGEWLRPPSTLGFEKRSDEAKRDGLLASEKRWHSELATEVARIWGDASGGTLVLCTSYATVNALKSALSQTHPTLTLVVAAPAISIGSQTVQFLQASQSGVRPLWLAVGGAWTGIDIGGHTPWAELFGGYIDASLDNVLTSLVIPRIPFGTNQSLSHLWRKRDRRGVPWDLLDAALRFLQGIGRLVRREGLPKNRRIYVLDARLSDPEQALRLAPFVRALSKYKRMVFVRDIEKKTVLLNEPIPSKT